MQEFNVGFLATGGVKPADYLRILLILAGDVEQNPGPGKCDKCNGALRMGYPVISCANCQHKFHKICTDETRDTQKKIIDGIMLWKCLNCKGEASSSNQITANVPQQTQRTDNHRDRCIGCEAYIRRNIVPVNCVTCNGKLHQTCCNLPRKDQKGNWKLQIKCLRCSNPGGNTTHIPRDPQVQQQFPVTCLECKAKKGKT